MPENPRKGRQARNFTTNVPKILDLKSSSEQIFFRKLSLGAPVYAFPDQMNWLFVLIMVSNLPSQASFLPLITWSYPNVKSRVNWFYKKPYICLLFNFQFLKKKKNRKKTVCQSNMFNFYEYICTKELLILGNNESSMATMSLIFWGDMKCRCSSWMIGSK